MLPQVERGCLPELFAPGSFGGLAPASLVRPDADLGPLHSILLANDPGQLKISAPVLIVQGDKDGTVFPAYTDGLVGQLRALGDSVDYRVIPGASHAGAVTVGGIQGYNWLVGKLG